VARGLRGVRKTRYSVPKEGNGFPRKHRWRLDADLIPPHALRNSRVEAFIEHITRYWRPEGDILLLSPCSNVKPYPLSPINRKIEASIKRAGAWERVEWVFISDLLGPVPYEYTWVPPACCYDARPSDVPRHWVRHVIESVEEWWGHVKGFFTSVIAFLPSKYIIFVKKILADSVPVTTLKYDVFYGQRRIELFLSGRADALKKS